MRRTRIRTRASRTAHPRIHEAAAVASISLRVLWSVERSFFNAPKCARARALRSASTRRLIQVVRSALAACCDELYEMIGQTRRSVTLMVTAGPRRSVVPHQERPASESGVITGGEERAATEANARARRRRFLSARCSFFIGGYAGGEVRGVCFFTVSARPPDL